MPQLVLTLVSHNVKQLFMTVFNKFLWAQKPLILEELWVRSNKNNLSSGVFQGTTRQGMGFWTSSYPDQPFFVAARLLASTVIVVCWFSGLLQSWREAMRTWIAEILQSLLFLARVSHFSWTLHWLLKALVNCQCRSKVNSDNFVSVLIAFMGRSFGGLDSAIFTDITLN